MQKLKIDTGLTPEGGSFTLGEADLGRFAESIDLKFKAGDINEANLTFAFYSSVECLAYYTLIVKPPKFDLLSDEDIEQLLEQLDEALYFTDNPPRKVLANIVQILIKKIVGEIEI